MTTVPGTPTEQWVARCEAVSKQARRTVIYEAFTEGGLTYRQISEALGDVSRQRVIQIVRAERELREERDARQEAPVDS